MGYRIYRFVCNVSVLLLALCVYFAATGMYADLTYTRAQANIVSVHVAARLSGNIAYYAYDVKLDGSDNQLATIAYHLAAVPKTTGERLDILYNPQTNKGIVDKFHAKYLNAMLCALLGGLLAWGATIYRKSRYKARR